MNRLDVLLEKFNRYQDLGDEIFKELNDLKKDFANISPALQSFASVVNQADEPRVRVKRIKRTHLSAEAKKNLIDYWVRETNKGSALTCVGTGKKFGVCGSTVSNIIKEAGLPLFYGPIEGRVKEGASAV